MFFFYLTFKAKMKFKECQPQVQQFGQNLIRCSHWKIIRVAVIGKLYKLQSLENYIKSAYYSNYPMTLYFQVQFLKLKRFENVKSTIKNALKSERKKKISLKKYHQELEKNARS